MAAAAYDVLNDANRIRSEKARVRYNNLRAAIQPLWDRGLSLRAIADTLNSSDTPPPSGMGRWHPMSVRRAVLAIQNPDVWDVI